MGKAIIQTNLGSGLYNVLVDYDTTRVDKELADLTTQIATTTARIATIVGEIATISSGITTLTNQLAALTPGTPAWEAKHTEIKTATRLLMDKTKERDLTTLKKKSFEARNTYLTGKIPADPSADIWCADLSDDLAIGLSVGTIEIAGEIYEMNIQPGYDGNAAYSQPRDGSIIPTVSQGAAQAFYNLAMFPGWQKWLPTYRYGVLTDIDYDLHTCSVALEAYESDAQNLDVNAYEVLTEVPIVYLD